MNQAQGGAGTGSGAARLAPISLTGSLPGQSGENCKRDRLAVLIFQSSHAQEPFTRILHWDLISSSDVSPFIDCSMEGTASGDSSSEQGRPLRQQHIHRRPYRRWIKFSRMFRFNEQTFEGDLMSCFFVLKLRLIPALPFTLVYLCTSYRTQLQQDVFCSIAISSGTAVEH